MQTLYGINKAQATLLLEHFKYSHEMLGLLLWNNGKASSIERGIYKAQKLHKFINK
ncbi:hypothetical protein KA025_01690 [Candidatus Saccharibacteria bacterium]|nr:hypothetical protein [Candidatus Saccharibacteria bacterium]